MHDRIHLDLALSNSTVTAIAPVAACTEVATSDLADAEDAKEIKRRTRHEGDMLQAEAIISQELGENPVVEYEEMPCSLNSDKLAVHKRMIKRLRGIHHVFKEPDLQEVLFKLGSHNSRCWDRIRDKIRKS